MKRRNLIVVFIFFLFCMSLFSKDLTDDASLNTSLLPSENPNLIFDKTKMGIDNAYVKRIIRRRFSSFFLNELDVHNISNNTNVSLHFPFTFIPFGGVNMIIGGIPHNSSRGIDIGLLYKMETLDNNISFSALNSYTTLGNFITHTQVNYYPDIIKDQRLQIYTGAFIITSLPQYYFLSNYHSPEPEYISKIFKRLGFDQNDRAETSFFFDIGFNYVIPFKEIVTDTRMRINYSYTENVLIAPYLARHPIEINNIQSSRLSVSLLESFVFSLQKQDKTIRTGELLRADFIADFPLLTESFDRVPSLSFAVTNIYNRKIWREFALKTRLKGGLNFLTNENLSGDGAVRGLNAGEFSGFAYLFANIDALIPIVHINLYSLADVRFKQKVNFLIYLALFVDGGVSLSKDSYSLRSFDFPLPYDQSTLNRYYFDDDTFANFAFTAGGGLRIYPYFLHFIVRLDVGVNILEAILYQSSPSIELTISLNDMY